MVSKRFFVNGWVPYVFAFYQDPPAHAFAATEGQRMLVEYLDCLVIVEVGNGDGSGCDRSDCDLHFVSLLRVQLFRS